MKRSLTRAALVPSPAFAGDAKDAKTESDCMMAGGTWDDTTKTCAKNKM